MKPLFPKRLREHMIRHYGIDPVSSDRRTGKTTSMALKTIALAIDNAGVDIPIVDHYDTHRSNLNLCDTIKMTIAMLNLQGFAFSSIRNTLRFCLIDEHCPDESGEQLNDKMIEEFESE